MRIDSYSFGKIVVDGETYTSDVIIHSARVEDTWWRREGHRLQIDDLAAVFESGPNTLVVGTGYYGNMKVPESTLDHLRGKGIDVHVAQTVQAVDLFNELVSDADRKVAAALHLTC